jgi:serine/threonine protein kinase
MPVETVQPGLRSVAQYDLLNKIADGGMGTVYRARHRDTGEVVAVKIVPNHLLNNPVYLKRFEQEYAAARALEHPNIVKALDFGREGDLPYLVMEYVEGESLGQRLDRIHHLSEREAIGIIGQAAQGLHKAHKAGLVHRDVKPDNMMLTKDGQVKLTDLGLVKELDTDLNLTRTGRGLGTPHFMAPEQFRNAKNADIRCDIYSLAATLYQMVTGELPFKSMSPLDAWMKKIHNELAPPRQLMPDLSERVDWAIRRSMSSDPNQRAATCREFVEDLTGQSTRKMAPDPGGIAEEDLWYMVFKDEDDVIHTVKGSTDGIRRSLKQGLLGDASNIRVARTKQGPFEPMRERPEFRDLVLEPAAPTMENTMKLPTPVTLPIPLTPPQVTMPPTSAPDSSFILPALPPAKVDRIAPNIVLERTEERPPPSEWTRWFVVTFLAVSAGIAGYFLVPVIYRLRLFW